MSSFLYFTEQAHRPVQFEDAQSWGLGYAFDEQPQSCELDGRTPTGGKGWLFFSQERLGTAYLGYHAELQVWRKIPGSEIWIGHDKGKRPGPQTLLRGKPLDGQAVELADGNQWLIPRLRIFSAARGFQSAMPVRVDLDDDGNWIQGEPVGDQERFAAIVERLIAGMLDSLLDDGIPPLTTLEMLDIATTLLQANYVVDKVEVAMLGLLTNDDLLMRIGRVAVDFDTAMDWAVKKNAESGLAAAAG